MNRKRANGRMVSQDSTQHQLFYNHRTGICRQLGDQLMYSFSSEYVMAENRNDVNIWKSSLAMLTQEVPRQR